MTPRFAVAARAFLRWFFDAVPTRPDGASDGGAASVAAEARPLRAAQAAPFLPRRARRKPRE